MIVILGSFESDETWGVTGSASLSGLFVHGGVQALRFNRFTCGGNRQFSPGLDLSGITSVTFYSYGFLDQGLPATGNKLDLLLSFNNGVGGQSASYWFNDILTESTENNVWVERTLAVADFTLVGGWDWTDVQYVRFDNSGNVSTRGKNLYMDDLSVNVEPVVAGEDITRRPGLYFRHVGENAILKPAGFSRDDKARAPHRPSGFMR